jgi:hypothetical protein
VAADRDYRNKRKARAARITGTGRLRTKAVSSGACSADDRELCWILIGNFKPGSHAVEKHQRKSRPEAASIQARWWITPANAGFDVWKIPVDYLTVQHRRS